MKNQQESKMHSIRRIYQWKTNITRFLRIDTRICVSKKACYQQKITEEQSWLGIG